MSEHTPGHDGGFFGWVSRRPRLAFSATLAAALVVGIGVGAAGVQRDGAEGAGDDSGALAKANEQLSDARAGRKDAERKLGEARDAVEATEGRRERPEAGPMGSSSPKEVQIFAGNGAKNLGTVKIPTESLLEWTNDGNVFQVLTAEEVPVNSQGRRGDTVLDEGSYKKFQVNAVGNWKVEIRPR